jgi:isopenicillin N synthase-like dioxygenase
MYAGAKVDLKESFVWGLDVPADDPDYAAGNRMHGPNRWPSFLPEMRPTLNAWFDAAHVCGRMLLGAFAASLGVAPDYFNARFAKPVTRGTLVYYPPQDPDAGEEQFGVAPHTDYGVMTLLHQDSTGGLQVRARSGEWVMAHPIPGTLVINVGDLLARWTNDRFRSTDHRVVNASGRERYSIAVFLDPDYDTPIVPVTQAGETAHYPPVTCGEYILSRFDQSFAYRSKS